MAATVATAQVLVACDSSEEESGRSLVAALGTSSIAARIHTVQRAETPPGSLPPCDLLVIVGGRGSPPRHLIDLVELARQTGIPVILACQPGAAINQDATDYARTSATMEFLNRRGQDLPILHARVTTVVQKFVKSSAAASAGSDQGMLSAPDQAMVSETPRIPRGDTAMRTGPVDTSMRTVGTVPWQPLLELPGDLGHPRNDLERAALVALRKGAVTSAEAVAFVVAARRHGLESLSDVERAVELSLPVASAPGSSSESSSGSTTERHETLLAGVDSLDAVHFGVTCPECLASPAMAIVDVWAFLSAQRQLILKAVREEHREPMTLVSQGPVRLARGNQLHARLWFEDLEVPDPLSSILWDGEVGKTSFVVKVPPGLSDGPRRGKVTILLAGMPLAHLPCVVTIETGPRPSKGKRTSSFDPARRRSAFASYASRDRREVLARVQGLEKAGVDVFLDVKSLRSGERYEARLLEEIGARDVFFLFWSKAARASQWVEKEWRFALAERGLDFIDPIPLVAPERVPPPKELADSLHFTDWTLAYASAQALVPRRWWQVWRT